MSLDPFDPRGWIDAAPVDDVHYIEWRETGIRARIDAVLFPHLSRWAWNAFVTQTAFKTYFRRTAADGRTTILLHREVLRLGHELGLAEPPPVLVDAAGARLRLVADHRDGNEFDCRLRWATYSVNSTNRRS